MRNRKVLAELIMHIAAILILGTATFVSTWAEPNPNTIIPFPAVTVPVINGISTLLAIVLLFIPNCIPLECTILSIQAVSTALTGYETLGIFLFTALIIILFCSGFFKTHAQRKILILFACWLLVIQGVMHQGIDRYIMVTVGSVFFIAFYFCIYKRLEVLLKPLMNIYAQNLDSEILKDKEVGQKISLRECSLDEREVNFTYDFLMLKKTYRELGDIYYTSTSTVKKVMAGVCKKFGVKNQTELRMLLMQYKVEK